MSSSGTRIRDEEQQLDTKKSILDLMTLGETEHSDTINHPNHYGGDVLYEAIKVIMAWKLNFNLGNAVKYICRAGKKGNKLEDLKKAQFYLNYEIELLEGKREV